MVGLAFVLPSFLMVLGLGWAYTSYGGLTWMQATFHGVGAAVIGIIAMSTQKLSTKSLGKDKLLWAIWGITAAVTLVTESEMARCSWPAGIAVWLWRTRRPSAHLSALAPVLPALPAASALFAADPGTLTQIGWFFAKAGTFVFGSGLATC